MTESVTGAGLHGIPQDQGWSFCVAAGAWLAFFVLGGLMRSSGIILRELESVFHIQSSYSIMLLSTQGIIYTVTSPVAVLLGERFTQRVIVMAAGLIGGCGTAIGSLMYSMDFLICTYGVAIGLANGLFLGNVILTLSMYFTRWRSLANGVCFSGSSIGLLVFPHLIQYLINNLSLRGTFLILGGVYFNIVVVGAVLRPKSFYERQVTQPVYTSNNMTLTHENSRDVLKSDVVTDLPSSLYVLEKDGHLYDHQLVSDRDSAIYYDAETIPLYYQDLNINDERTLSRDDIFLDTLNTTNHFPAPRGDTRGDTCSDKIEPDSVSEQHHHIDSSYVSNRSSDHSTQAVPAYNPTSAISKKKRILLGIKFFLSGYKNFHIAVYSIASFFSVSGSFNIVFYIPYHSRLIGASKYDRATLLIIAAVGDLCGRIIVGFVGDLKHIVRYKLQAAITLVSSVNTILLLVSSTFVWAACHCLMYGFFLGSFITLLPVVLLDLAGKENMSKGLSALLLCQGLGVAFLQPALGALRDAWDSTDGVFALCGLLAFIGGVTLLFHPLLHTILRKVRVFITKPRPHPS